MIEQEFVGAHCVVERRRKRMLGCKAIVRDEHARFRGEREMPRGLSSRGGCTEHESAAKKIKNASPWRCIGRLSPKTIDFRCRRKADTFRFAREIFRVKIGLARLS